MPLPSPQSLCTFFFCFIFLSPTPALQILLVAPISKDSTTQLYTLSLYLNTTLHPTTLHLHLHLGSSFTWILCDSTNTSSYSHIPCNSSLCDSFHSNACSNHSCALFPENPLTRTTLLDTAIIDSLALPTSDGPLLLISHFIFSCSKPPLLQGLAHNATGLAALGRSNYSPPGSNQRRIILLALLCTLLTRFAFHPGLGFFGSTGPYIFNSKIDLSKSLIYTPLIVNPVGDTVVAYNGQPSDEYFINLTSIRINGKDVPVNASILTVDQNGYGGTKISTAEPYTVLETSIYKRFVEHFVNESKAFNLTVTEAVEPFGVCYPASGFTETRVGPAVPTVDLVMHSEDVFWRIFGGNSMVRIENEGANVWCLGFVDGGTHRRTPVTIGGHQLEDNLVQFDLESNRFGFSSSLLLQATTCANLNITTNFANYRN